jgi:hypothetical protein
VADLSLSLWAPPFGPEALEAAGVVGDDGKEGAGDERHGLRHRMVGVTPYIRNLCDYEYSVPCLFCPRSLSGVGLDRLFLGFHFFLVLRLSLTLGWS